MQLHDYRKLKQQRTSDTVLITGGIGDVLALTCFLDTAPVKHVFYATRRFEDVAEILRKLLPDATHESAWSDWSDRWAFYSLGELLRSKHDDRLIGAADWSISAIFPQQLPYDEPAWLSIAREVDLSRFNLPEKYVLLCPFSTDKRDALRDFTDREILEAVAAAKAHGLPVVYQYVGGDRHQIADVIDLSNQTSMWESIALAAQASAYIGIDSALSQVVTKHLPAERLAIKSTNVRPGYGHYYTNLRWYCAPHDTYDFVGRNLDTLLARMELS